MSSASNKKGRVVIRNLVYDVHEKHLRNLLSKYGEITEVNIPINPSTNKSKGFAFVQFSNKNHALKAIKELNEKTFKGRTVLLDLAFDKKEYEKNNVDHSAKEGKIDEEEKKEENDDGDNENIEDEKENEENVENENDEIEKEEEKLEKNLNDDEKLQKEEKDKKLSEVKDENLDNTVFLSNLTYELTDKEFRDFANNFGPFEYAKLVKNKETLQNKGTAFIKFKEKKTADYIVELSEKIEMNSTSVLNSVEANHLNLKERRVIAKHAKNRAEIAQKEKENKGKPVNLRKIKELDHLVKLDRKNKRKLHLAKFGVFQPTEDLDEEEQERRAAYVDEKIQKLKNPNYFVSETRILIKHLPKKNFDESSIKEIVQNYFKKNYEANILKKKKMLKTVKILRNKEMLNENNEPKSKGIAFVDFVDPEDALKFITHFSKKENYSEFNKNKPPIIEFSIEDIRKTKKIELAISSKKKERKLDEKDAKKKEEMNKTTHTYKLLIEELLNKNDVENYETIKEYMRNIKSRGIKQRLNKRITSQFGIEKTKPEKQDQIKNQKKEKKQNKKKVPVEMKEKNDKKQNLKRNESEKNKEEIKKIMETRKKKNTLKRKAVENDEFDNLAENYRMKIQKKVKWDHD